MDADPVPVPAKPSNWPIALVAVTFSILVLAAAALGFCGFMQYTDSYSHEPDRRWGVLGMAGAGVLFVTSAAAILFLIVRKRAVWLAALGLVAVALLGLVVVIWAGFGMLEATKHRGGDWAAVGVLGSTILGIMCPGLAGLLTVAAGASLLAARRTIVPGPGAD